MPGRGPVRRHAHPVTPAARRRADRASRRAERSWRRPAGGAWRALAGVLGVIAIAVAASTQLGAARFGLTAADGPSPSATAAPLASPSSPPATPAVASPSAEPSGVPLGLPTGYGWPVDHARITSWFGPLPGEPYLVDGQSFHDGIDIASFCGDRVTAAHDGTILLAGRDSDPWYGWVGSYAPHEAVIAAKHLLSTLAIEVITDDGNGFRSVYMHLAKAVVKAGQQVTAGQLIGYEGRTGNATGCHLHFSIFSPSETAVFETAAWAIKKWTLPAAEIARIDPLLVLPPMASADVTWGWGARD